MIENENCKTALPKSYVIRNIKPITVLTGICVCACVLILTACGTHVGTPQATSDDGIMYENTQRTGNDSGSTDDGTLNIVATIFPEYDWVMNIIGDDPPTKTEVTLLLDNGVDLHSFQPTADDILRISLCDVFIYVGGESDKWVDDALSAVDRDDIIVVNLLDVLGSSVKEEEIVEGMQEEADEVEEDDDEDEVEYDEHVWLSLKNAEILCDSMADAIAGADPANVSIYKANVNEYISKLDELDSEYKETTSTASVKTLLFGDRFPFRYLTDDYGLDYYAAFAGCSAETEASFETITFLSGKVDELSLSAVLTIEGTDHSIAETIVQNTKEKNQKILTLDSMQSTTARDIESGASYLNIMKENLGVLKEALNNSALP